MDRSTIALQVVGLGLGVTLTALFLLYLMLSVFGKLFFKQKKNVPERGSKGIAKSVVPVDMESVSGLNEKLIAAIVGSVSTLLLDEQAKQPFKISIATSLETGLAGRAWVLIGRKEIMTGALKLAALRRRKGYAEI